MKFDKYSGAGNTFIITDRADLSATVIAQHCNSHQVDGLISMQGMVMRYYNADGHEAAMCGNGLRCAIKYLWDNGLKQPHYEIETKAGVQRGTIQNGQITCYLRAPTALLWDQQLYLKEQAFAFHSLNTGVPHAVLFMTPTDVTILGKKIRNHPFFAPHGTNVNFVTSVQSDCIAIRTYERGVERETLACGTGAIASALATYKKYGMQSPLRVKVQSGEFLTITFRPTKEGFDEISLTGNALKIAD